MLSRKIPKKKIIIPTSRVLNAMTEYCKEAKNCLGIYFRYRVTQVKIRYFKPILTLQTWGQKCFDSDSDPFEITDFDLGHPVNVFTEYFSKMRESGFL